MLDAFIHPAGPAPLPYRRIGLALLLPFLLASVTPGCASPVPRPPGVPETPYWFVVQDSVLWFAPADSLALVQLAEGTNAQAAESSLYAIRELGWRMTPARGPALQRAGQEQNLTQELYQVEKVPGATSPSENWSAFESRFWKHRDSAPPSVLGILPGLQAFGEAPTKYYWPNCIAITWGDSLTAAQATDWLNEQGCRVLTSPQLVHQYYVQRIWVVEIPAGTRLFDWLRKLNDEPSVESAFPVSSLREPPTPDPRDMGRNLLAQPSDPGPGSRPQNCSVLLWEAYQIARFAGFTAHVARATPVEVKGDLFKVMIYTRKGEPAADSALVAEYGGQVALRSGVRMEAWVPYVALPDLARESRVLKLDVAAR
jgi:hypothetical protein